MIPGDHVEWTNGSYFIETVARGLVIAISNDHVVVLNQRTALHHPHVNPFVVKRLWELHLIPGVCQPS